jgi:hypothetical protein
VKRLGKKVCVQNHRIEKSKNDRFDKTGVIKYEDIKRIGVSVPIKTTSVNRPTKVITSRPLSSASIQ